MTMETIPALKRTRSPSILLIEADLKAAEAVRDELRAAGFTVETLKTVRAGLRKIREKRYSAVVVDTELPDGSGFEVAAAIRGAAIDVPVLLLAGSQSRDGMIFIRGPSPSADSVFDDLPVLAQRLETLIRRDSLRPAATVRFGGLYMDRVRRAATCGGSVLRLTPNEYRILELLLLNAPRSVDTQSLLRVISGDAESGNRNLLAVHVRNIRRKMESLGCSDMLQTARGQGYVLQDPSHSGTGPA